MNEFPPINAAEIADDIYYFITADTTGLGYGTFYDLHEDYLDLPEPPPIGQKVDYSSLPILKGTTGSLFLLKSQTGMGLTAFGKGQSMKVRHL